MIADTPWPWMTHATAARTLDAADSSLAKRVRDDMLALILKGVWVPGQRINEPDAASRLGVSRVPVREALRELESSGLVVARKHSGVFVRELETSEIQDLYQLRGLLDGFAGRQSAQLGKAAKTALLQALTASGNAMQDAADRSSVQEYYAENLRFHWLIVTSANNGALSQTYRGIVQKLHLSRLKNLSQDLGMRSSIAEHRDIIQAVADGDPQHCEALMSSHVGVAFRRLNQLTPRPRPAAGTPASRKNTKETRS
jgi:DNA-binding GntR family transcriptional regulator